MTEPTDTDVERDRTLEFQSVSLGEIDPARSRHMWTRSAVHVAADCGLVVTGEWNGTVTAREADSLEPRWTVTHPDHPVGITTLEGTASDEGSEDGTTARVEREDDTPTVVVAGRGETGAIAAYDAATGEQRWRYDTVTELGEAGEDSVFYRPYVVDCETDGERLYAAARRYERDGDARRWHSVVYAFDPGGSLRWTYGTDASPIAIDLDDDGERLAVGYNRCTGDHDTGLVVLEANATTESSRIGGGETADTGELAWTWDPGTEGDRRVGDVAWDGGTIAVASHGDKRGYLLGPGGAERWRVDLAVETEIDDETLYAYPNHVHATDGRIAFVTGNTYALESRETENRHPDEHRIVAVDADGDRLWDDDVRGFVHGLAGDGDAVVAPCAQNFRVRDPETHAIRQFDLENGPRGSERFAGIATAAAVADGTLAAIEEPVEYHDEGETRGAYRLHVATLE